eukprot:scaffold104037_cov33-Prasinocladus_malaysianus.AAC.1
MTRGWGSAEPPPVDVKTHRQEIFNTDDLYHSGDQTTDTELRVALENNSVASIKQVKRGCDNQTSFTDHLAVPTIMSINSKSQLKICD